MPRRPYQVIDVALALQTAGIPFGPNIDISPVIQLIINAAPDGIGIYFAPGTYTFGDVFIGPRLAGVGRAGLRFFGDGHSSILQRRFGAERLATIRGSTGITFTNLCFDANSLGGDGQTHGGGGLFFDRCRRIRITDTRSIDSNFAHPDQFLPLTEVLDEDFEGHIQEDWLPDRNAFLFARSADVWVTGNIIEDQQLSFAASHSVLIADNTILNAVFRAIKIGALESPGFPGSPTPERNRLFDLAYDADYEVVDNIIDNPWTHGIHCGPGPFSDSRAPDAVRPSILQRIRLAGNIIRKFGTQTPAATVYQVAPAARFEVHVDPRRRSRAYGCGILIGRGRVEVNDPDPTDTYSHITIENNRIRMATNSSDPLDLTALRMSWDSHGIFLRASPPLSPGAGERGIFTKVTIQDNLISGVDSVRTAPPTLEPTGILCEGLVDGVIARNGVFGGAFGVSLRERSKRTHLFANRVGIISRAGYHMTRSGGDNWFVHNAVLSLNVVPGAKAPKDYDLDRDGAADHLFMLKESTEHQEPLIEVFDVAVAIIVIAVVA